MRPRHIELVDGVCEWEAAGDAALRLRFGYGLDPHANGRALAWAEMLEKDRPAGVWGVVPGHATLLVEFDPQVTDAEAVLAACAAQARLPETSRTSRTVVVPVLYGGEAGPDLESVADRLGLSPNDVVGRHAGRPYRIFCVGFAPGQPLAGPLDARLVVPRRESPRPRVQPGSVALAGWQTGIYPAPTPGGWHIIGRTPLTLFDPARRPPVPYRPGDTLRFEPVDASTFDRLAGEDAYRLWQL